MRLLEDPKKMSKYNHIFTEYINFSLGRKSVIAQNQGQANPNK